MLLPNPTLPVSDPIRDRMLRILNQVVLDRIPPEQWQEMIAFRAVSGFCPCAILF